MIETEEILKLKTNFHGTAYRNIYTIFTSQNLFDDLIGPDAESEAILQKYENATSGISHVLPQKNRLFDYSQAHPSCISGSFLPPYSKGRFGDGNGYGVWYSALEEKTSIFESFYHQWKFAQEQFIHFPNEQKISVDRKMFACSLTSENVFDFSNSTQWHNQLISDNYEFCRELGKKIKPLGGEMLIVPSARKSGGFCAPVFSPDIIVSEKTIYYLKYYFYSDGKAEIEKISKVKEIFTVPSRWKEEANIQL
ncbi:RES domain-containing protein [Fluviispira sanaruensis]|uniref:RES domain-containing protein n=1 Tax=Fluviispira sanaruensis TaxID=2493639 RepID=A0A4P2VIM1_FLUSA|nr:RES domain-containing protein [Fluviispira sanaruensis]